MNGTNTLRDMSDHKRGTVTELNREESRKLRAIWDAKKDKPTQAVFGEQFGIGSQAAVGHFLNGHAAISLKAARGFAEGLRCDISAFSPRLAKEASELGKAAGQVADHIDMTALHRMEMHLVLLFRDLSADGKDEVIALANKLHNVAKPVKSEANPWANVAPHPTIAPAPKPAGKAKAKGRVDVEH